MVGRLGWEGSNSFTAAGLGVSDLDHCLSCFIECKHGCPPSALVLKYQTSQQRSLGHAAVTSLHHLPLSLKVTNSASEPDGVRASIETWVCPVAPWRPILHEVELCTLLPSPAQYPTSKPLLRNRADLQYQPGPQTPCLRQRA